MWQIFGHSTIGLYHLRRGLNCQDASFVSSSPDFQVGFIADGCSQSLHSEIGAKQTASFLVRRATELLSIVSTKALPDLLFNDLIGYLKAQVAAQLLPDLISERYYIQEFLYATALGLIVTPTDALILACGDGLIAADDLVFFLNQDNTPTYPAYCLPQVDDDLTLGLKPNGFTIFELDPSNLHSLTIASDSFENHTDLLLQVSVISTRNQLRMALNRWTKLDQLLEDDATVILARKETP